ncbi:hypothetical protein [Streptosporangium sp. NPDC006007]|uniref:hypothetical protein n=1 Tax=Streptosporangium sp. NPDC006007 TaxID=3154575 RepID=UPI0033AAD201
MTESVFVLGIIIVAALLIGVATWQGLATYRTKIEASKDRSYRLLVEEAVVAQTRVAREIAELRVRLGEVERLLKEID